MGQSRVEFCVVKEFFCALEVEVEGEDQCARLKKVKPNQDDTSDHFLSARRLHTRPTSGSSDRFLLLKPFLFHPPHGHTRSTQPAAIASAKPRVRSHQPSKGTGTQLGALLIRPNKQ